MEIFSLFLEQIKNKEKLHSDKIQLSKEKLSIFT